MIDFRYHLVSLISVFLALAVGIVLGAGPLRESLGTQLAGQVEQLRTDKETLRTENDRLTAQNDQLGTYIAQTAPQLVAGTLDGSSVAILAEDDSTRESTDEISSLVPAAGGTVPVRVTLGGMLWDPAQASARAEAVTALRKAAPDLPLTGADDSERLAGAIAAVLLEPDDALPSEQRDAALDALSSSQVIRVDGELDGSVDALVHAGAAPDALTEAGDDTATAAARAQALSAVQTRILDAVVEADVPAVIAGSTPGSDDTTGIIRIARGDARYDALSTVDGLQRADGPPVAVLALGEQTRGGAGDYGTGAGARARVPEADATSTAPSAPAQPSDAGGAAG